MGRRAKRPSRETAMRMRLGSIPAPLKTSAPRMCPKTGKAVTRKTDAVQEWAMKVFIPAYGREPSEAELCAALDSGTIGHWIDSVTKVTVVDVISVLREPMPVRSKDMTYQKGIDKEKERVREIAWVIQAQDETIAAVMAGKLKAVTPESLKTHSDKLYADIKGRWECEQLILKHKARG